MTFILDRELGRRLTPLALKLYLFVTHGAPTKKQYVSLREVVSVPAPLFTYLTNIIPRTFTYEMHTAQVTNELFAIESCRHPESVDVLKLVLRFCGEFTRCASMMMYQGLYESACYGNLTAMKMILKVSIAHYDSTFTPLKLAVQNNHMHIIKFILKSSEFDLSNNRGLLFDWAMEIGNIDLAMRLKDLYDIPDSCYADAMISSIKARQFHAIKYCMAHIVKPIDQQMLNRWLQLSEALGITHLARYFRLAGATLPNLFEE